MEKRQEILLTLINTQHETVVGLRRTDWKERENFPLSFLRYLTFRMWQNIIATFRMSQQNIDSSGYLKYKAKPSQAYYVPHSISLYYSNHFYSRLQHYFP
jgi:hypothetical protein